MDLGRRWIKALLPPAVAATVRLLKERLLGYGFYGDYESWRVAAAHSTGYATNEMLARVPEWVRAQRTPSTLLTRRAEQVLAAMSVPLRHYGRALRVLDFGGGTGAHYYMARHFLGEFDWHVVEIPQMVAACQPYAEAGLRFSTQPDQRGGYDLVIMSSVLPYVEDPVSKFEELSSLAAYSLIDRTYFIDGKDRLTVQRVPASNYRASYPCWFLNEASFVARIQQRHRILMQWHTEDVHLLDGKQIVARGLLVARVEND